MARHVMIFSSNRRLEELDRRAGGGEDHGYKVAKQPPHQPTTSVLEPPQERDPGQSQAVSSTPLTAGPQAYTWEEHHRRLCSPRQT